jgi:hypothetical protein
MSILYSIYGTISRQLYSVEAAKKMTFMGYQVKNGLFCLSNPMEVSGPWPE